MTKAEEKFEREWHLDKKVPIALIATLMIQTGGLIWWARGLDARIEALEKNDAGRSNQTSQLNSIAVDIAVLKENVKTTKDDISSMKNGFDMLMQQVLEKKR